MGLGQRIIRFFLIALFAFSVTVSSLSGCNSIQINQVSNQAEPLPTVSELPLPTLPDWIEEISPTDKANALAQIRIRFSYPLIPVERIDTPKQKAILQQFQLIPAISGHFRFLTPRMVGFQADEPLPKATRFQVTLKSGLADLDNHQLQEDLAWTFETEAIQFTGLPGTIGALADDAEPNGLQEEKLFSSNTQLNLDSVIDHAVFVQDDQDDQTISALVNFQDSPQSESGQFDPDREQFHYVIKPQKPLEKATHYRLEMRPGILPLRGNLATKSATVTHLKTYAPLKFTEMEFYGKPDAGGAYGRFEKGSPYLMFNNGLDADSAIANIRLDPKPETDSPILRTYPGSRSVELNPWVLQPATKYTITLSKNLKDQYGQTLGQDQQITYNPGDVAGEIWAQRGLHIFPAGTDLSLDVETINIPSESFQAAYRVIQPTDLVYTDSAYPQGNGTDLLPQRSQWPSFDISQQKNQLIKNSVPLQEKLGQATGMLAYGITAQTNTYLNQNNQEEWRSPEYYGFVQLTNLGVFAQWFPESGIVRVHHLDTGQAVANAQIEIYQSRLNSTSRGNPQACLTGTTDAAGTLTVFGNRWRRCLQGQTYGPELLVIARENTDWAFVRTHDYSGAYGYGIYAGWDDGQPQSRGTIFSDRQLYQPKEKAYFTGIAYSLKNGKLSRENDRSYQVVLRDPEGKETRLGSYQTNRYGTFSVEWDIPADQALGNYSLSAEAEDETRIYGYFRVAEFRPPNFKVDLSLSQQFVQMGDRLTASATGTYLFGAPVGNSRVKYYVTRTRSEFRPDGWEEYDFGRRWHWSEEEPTISSEVLQLEKNLDDQGRSSQEIKVAKDLPYPTTYRVETEVTDVANSSVSNTQTFIALPSDHLIGLKHDFVANAGEPFTTEVIVTTPKGNSVAGQTVELELQAIEYNRVTQIIEGSQVNRPQVTYKTIATESVRPGNRPKQTKLAAPEAGSYRLHAKLSGEDDASATDSFIWVSGKGAFNWGDRFDNNRVEVTLDKNTYDIGDTATALIQSPYPQAELYFSVIRHGVLYDTQQTVEGAAAQVEFKITPDMLPNAAVEAVLVRQGESLDAARENGVDKLMKIGFRDFSTNLESKQLQVEVTPQQEELTPASAQTLKLELKDLQGKAVRGQLTVMVVNEAILQLSGYRPPDLIEEIYQDQPITTRWADNRPDVSITPLDSAVQKGWGYGGGLSSALANTRTRKDFRPIAYYNGSVLTNAQGKAEVTFNLPDDLTTWRVLVVATDDQIRFGNGEATFVATQPLLSNPVLPQFARVGDRFLGGVLVTNNTGQKGKLQVQAQVQGSAEFSEGNSQTQRLDTQIDNTTEAYRFPITATQAGTSTFKFVTQKQDATDALEIPLEVKNLTISEQAIATGVLTDESLTLPLNLDRQVVPDQGGLTLSLASTLIPELTAPAQATFNQDDFPFLEPAASQLLIAANLKRLHDRYGQAFEQFEITQEATQALNDIQQLQLPSGGFGSYPGDDTPDPYVTPYAAEAIAQAQQAGITVDEAFVSRLKRYLDQTLANPSQFSECKTADCKATVRLETLLALDAFGDRRSDFVASLHDARENFDTVETIQLARLLAQRPDWQTQAQTLAEEVRELISQSGRSGQINLPDRWYWYHSQTTAQAQALRLLVALQEQPETLAPILQGLLDQRRDGTWSGTYNNAQAFAAAAAYSDVEATPPSFATTVTLDQAQLADVEFQGYDNPSTTVQVPMAELPKGDRQLTLTKSGEGKLHYLSELSYRLQGSQPGKLNGLRITRYVRPANQSEVVQQYGLYDTKKPLTVESGQVFDIGLEIITDHPVDHVLISDPLPAGFEAIDTSFQTATTYYQPQQDSWQLRYQKIYRDKVIAYGDRLNAGVYNLHYLVRAATPGEFDYPGAEVTLQYAPETFGRSTSSLLRVE